MLKAGDEALLKLHFGHGQTIHGGSTSGYLLERAALYRVRKPPPKRTESGKLVRDAALDDIHKQWNAFRKRAKAYALRQETLIAFWGWCLSERPWKASETALPRLHAVYVEIDRLHALWEAGAMPSEAGIIRWIKRDVLPLRSGHVAPEITARPTAETRTTTATEPAGQDLVKAAVVTRALQHMTRAGKVAEVQALETCYGPPGETFIDQGLPRHWALMLDVPAGPALWNALPKSGAGRWYEQLANACNRRDRDDYAQHAERFAEAELQADRLYARACRAWTVVRDWRGGGAPVVT